MTRSFKLISLYVAGLFLLIVAALFHQQEHLYLMAAALFLIPNVANLVGRLFMGGLACERSEVPACSVGERVTVTLLLTAVGSLPKFYLRVQERLPRWLRLVGDGAPLILQLQPGESRPASYALEPEKRGIYTLGPVLVVTTDPFGFYTYTQSLPCPGELVVYPAVVPLHQLFIEGGGAWGRENQDEGAMRGDGLDFHGVREYQTGDELRRVHWRTTARTGKLVVMEYTQGMTGDVLLALDLNRSAYADTGEGPEGALECAVKAAAAVGAYLLQRGHPVHLLTVDGGVTPPLQNAEDVPRLLEALARAEADSAQPLSRLLQDRQAEVSGGKTLIFITPDAADAALGPVLDDCRALGARAFGLFLDGASFRDRGRSSDRHLPDWAAAAPTQRVGWGDDLQQTIEGWNYARR